MFYETQHSISNHHLIRFIGSDATNFLSFLEDKFEYYKNLEKLTTHENEEGYFFVTVQEIEKNFGFKKKAQINIIKTLIDKDFIKQVNFGIPCKRYFKINKEIIIKHLSQYAPKEPTSTLQRSQLYSSKGDNCIAPKEITSPYKNILYTKRLYTNIISSSAPSKKKSEKTASTHAASPIRAVDNIKFNVSSFEFEGITEVDRANWKVAYPDTNIDKELARMIEWLRSNPNKIKKQWRRFITGWLDRQNSREVIRGSYHSTGQDQKRSQFEIRHQGLNHDTTPVNPKRVFDYSNYTMDKDGKWIPG